MKATLLATTLLTLLCLCASCARELSEEDTTIQREEEIRREDVRGPDQNVPAEEGVEEMEYDRDVLNQ